MSKHKLQKICSGILLAFTLISIGYMLGKNSVHTDSSLSEERANDTYIAVYYLHSTFRCETCNTIESMTRDLLDEHYRQEIDDGMIRWQDIDFIKNTDIAKQFDVAASCVVVAQITQGQVSDFTRLDQVWTLMENPSAFNSYISDTVDSYLTGKES